MEHTPAWINRKFNQVRKEQYEKHQQTVFAGMQSMMLLIDAAFNKGKDFNKILPPSLEEALKVERQQKLVQENFVSGAWWEG